MKITFEKFQPRIVHYKDYKNFQNDRYRDGLIPKLSNIVTENNNIRLNEFLSILNGNHLPFMYKIISKEIMKRTRFQNQFFKNGTDKINVGTKTKEQLCLTIKKNKNIVF